MYALAAALFALATPSPATLALGAVPVALGAWTRLWATGHLVKNDELAVGGPYAYLRNPLYLGTLLVATGFAVMAWNPLGWIALAAFVAGYFVYYMPYKNRIEGARLEMIYGDAYRRYAVSVPSLLPRLTPYRPLRAERPTRSGWHRDRVAENHEMGTQLAVAMGVLLMVARWASL